MHSSLGGSTIVADIDPRYYYLTLFLLAACTIVGLVIAFRFQREVDHDLAPTTEKDLLDPLEKAYYSGLMDEEEIHRIRESMHRRKAGYVDPAPTIPMNKNPVKPPEFMGPGPMAETQADDD
ncbi:hypothetical protein P12x_001827 [Tundrisphaera lichenicola]|uniref:hypothetical protein n=1 Tax=Tundrisphaera lichenicola TaxID=2029860 RepID=UPI003EBF1629